LDVRQARPRGRACFDHFSGNGITEKLCVDPTAVKVPFETLPIVAV
jgi:hypothetical protein